MTGRSLAGSTAVVRLEHAVLATSVDVERPVARRNPFAPTSLGERHSSFQNAQRREPRNNPFGPKVDPDARKEVLDIQALIKARRRGDDIEAAIKAKIGCDNCTACPNKAQCSLAKLADVTDKEKQALNKSHEVAKKALQEEERDANKVEALKRSELSKPPAAYEDLPELLTQKISESQKPPGNAPLGDDQRLAGRLSPEPSVARNETVRAIADQPVVGIAVEGVSRSQADSQTLVSPSVSISSSVERNSGLPLSSDQASKDVLAQGAKDPRSFGASAAVTEALPTRSVQGVRGQRELEGTNTVVGPLRTEKTEERSSHRERASRGREPQGEVHGLSSNVEVAPMRTRHEIREERRQQARGEYQSSSGKPAKLPIGRSRASRQTVARKLPSGSSSLSKERSKLKGAPPSVVAHRHVQRGAGASLNGAASLSRRPISTRGATHRSIAVTERSTLVPRRNLGREAGPAERPLRRDPLQRPVTHEARLVNNLEKRPVRAGERAQSLRTHLPEHGLRKPTRAQPGLDLTGKLRRLDAMARTLGLSHILNREKLGALQRTEKLRIGRLGPKEIFQHQQRERFARVKERLELAMSCRRTRSGERKDMGGRLLQERAREHVRRLRLTEQRRVTPAQRALTLAGDIARRILVELTRLGDVDLKAKLMGEMLKRFGEDLEEYHLMRAMSLFKLLVLLHERRGASVSSPVLLQLKRRLAELASSASVQSTTVQAPSGGKGVVRAAKKPSDASASGGPKTSLDIYLDKIDDENLPLLWDL